jgi:MerR family copper efflux transcriptional regulator
MAEIAELVGLWRNRKRASASVKRIAQRHLDELAQRIEAMQAMQRSLQALLASCHGDSRPRLPDPGRTWPARRDHTAIEPRR